MERAASAHRVPARVSPVQLVGPVRGRLASASSWRWGVSRRRPLSHSAADPITAVFVGSWWPVKTRLPVLTGLLVPSWLGAGQWRTEPLGAPGSWASPRRRDPRAGGRGGEGLVLVVGRLGRRCARSALGTSQTTNRWRQTGHPEGSLSSPGKGLGVSLRRPERPGNSILRNCAPYSAATAKVAIGHVAISG